MGLAKHRESICRSEIKLFPLAPFPSILAGGFDRGEGGGD